MPSGGFLGSGTSVGAAIGLTAAPEGEAAGFSLAEKAESQVAEQRRAAAERQRAAKAKADAVTEKEIEKITPYQTATVDQSEAQAFVNKKLESSLDAYKSGSPDAYYKVTRNMKDVKQEALKNQPLIAQEKEAIGFLKEAEQSGTAANNPYLIGFADAIQQPSRDALKALAKQAPHDPTGQVIIDPNTGHYQLNRAPKINTDQKEAQYANKALTDIQSYTDASYLDPKGGVKKYDVSSVPETTADSEEIQKKFNLPSTPPSVESLTKYSLNDPDYRRRKEVNLINAEVLPPNYYDLPKDKRDKLLTPLVKNDLIQNGRIKIAPKVVEQFKPESTTQKNAAEKNNISVVYDPNTRTATFNKNDAKEKGPMKFTTPNGEVITGIPHDIHPGPDGQTYLYVDVEVSPKTKYKEAVINQVPILYGAVSDKLSTEFKNFDYYAVQQGLKNDKLDVTYVKKDPEHGKLTTVPKVAAEKKTEAKELKVTKSQVEEAAKAKRMSVEAYLKAAEKAGHKIIVQ